MCGICGEFWFDGRSYVPGTVDAMTQTLTHRGPDSRGGYEDAGVGLGHARLSVIELSDAGRQPMATEQGHSVLVFNGEIYNYRTLKRELVRRGARFRGSSDTEVVLQAIADQGPAAFEKLEGMFALANWDARADRLHLARDRFGIKPLYYYCDSKRLVFGSEIKAILAAGGIPRELHWQALHEYLHYGTALGENTFFKGIKRLPPGHQLTADKHGVQISAYASILETTEITDDFPTAASKVRKLLEEAVQSHLISDVPVGVFLSGGIDSAAITAFASKHSPGRLKTFSAGFDFIGDANELPQARAVAEKFGTEHHELHIHGGELPPVIEALLTHHDQPFGDAANIPLFLLCRHLAGQVKVILQGDGGDEMFGGYRRYTRLRHQRIMSLLSPFAAGLRSFLPSSSVAYRSLRTLHALQAPHPAKQMALLMSQEPPDQPPERLFSGAVQAELLSTNPFQRYEQLFQQVSANDPVQRMLYIDSSIILPDLYFEKVDRATMAHGIEVRVPMVDTRLSRYAMSLPSHYKASGFQLKRVLRRALRGVVPDSILDSPKRGFGVPVSAWLRGPLAGYLQSVLLDSSTHDLGLFDSASLQRCIQEHLSGRRDHGSLLYKLLQLTLWHRFYLQENACASPAATTNAA